MVNVIVFGWSTWYGRVLEVNEGPGGMRALSLDSPVRTR